ncbi:hypothetical protein MD484_g8127, partial [Candolleomyces efflorescens]
MSLTTEHVHDPEARRFGHGREREEATNMATDFASIPIPADTGCTSFFKDNAGLFLVASAQALFSLLNMSVKQLSSIDPPVSAIQVVNVGMSITYFCCIVYMCVSVMSASLDNSDPIDRIWAKVPDPLFGPKGVRLLLAYRGILGFSGLFAIYYSLEYLSLSDATVLTFLVPMFTTVSGALFLGETFSVKQALATAVSMIGVILIARPVSLFGEPAGNPLNLLGIGDEFDLLAAGPKAVTPSERMFAVGVALCGVLGATGAYTILRAIGRRAHPLHPLVSFSSQCVIISTIIIIASGEKLFVPTTVEALAMFSFIGVFGFFAQTLLTMGLQRETASRGSMAVYTQIVFATIFERIFFNAVPPLLSAIGIVLILSSATYTALSKGQDLKCSSSEEPQNVRFRHSEDGGDFEPYTDDIYDHEENHSHDDEDRMEGSSRMTDQDDHEDRELVLPLFSEDNFLCSRSAP